MGTAGAIGNTGEAMLHGVVTDFIAFRVGDGLNGVYICNLADMMLWSSTLLILGGCAIDLVAILNSAMQSRFSGALSYPQR